MATDILSSRHSGSRAQPLPKSQGLGLTPLPSVRARLLKSQAQPHRTEVRLSRITRALEVMIAISLVVAIGFMVIALRAIGLGLVTIGWVLWH